MPMNNSSRTILLIVIFLVVIIAITAYMNRKNVVMKTELNNEAVFTVIDHGEEIASYTMDEIQAIGEVTFRANLKTDGKEAISHDYIGVPLRDIIEKSGISIEGRTSVIVSAIDGYVVSVSMDKVLDDENVYLAYKRGGKWIGTREDGGKGPYQMIISKDPFSQYWCKYAYSVEVK